ncbi:nicotinamide mononucleotide transporter [Thermovibrio ammonificans]|jgi:nicotinamide mononucleotide transporter|uniref:Nicotinamide mononucleotide transporter n=1 Tax=Thermovibrio ammonificans (strain DSM 15698 / JCM 12110 / HB-1) TaxID=648996 RepID=E8T5U1_THEA1|nr:nicotinamide mononucleotide transporter [Thermovibrio ammonificans]ADU97667.1 putative nicotinamide mononucleotide transporter [Thermovibrio ammonificans HB-1]
MERSSFQKKLEIVASVIGVVALFITAIGYPQVGFVVALFASALYATYGYLTKQYGIMVSSLIYAAVEVVGIIRWVFLGEHNG